MADTKEKRVQVSVLLDPDTHRAAKIAAMDAGLSLTQWIAQFINKALKGRKQAA